MSLGKTILLAVTTTLLLTYILGVGVKEFFDIDIYINNQVVEPLKAISLTALFSVFIVLVTMFVVLSIFGGFILIILAVLGGVLMTVVGVFWPILLIALAIGLYSYVNRSDSAHIK